MDNEFLPLAVHQEYAKRMEDEHKRQNQRIGELENTVKDMSSLTSSVASLAQSIEQLAKAQEKHSARLETLEGRDGEMWRKVAGYIVTFVVGAVLSFVFASIGLS
jgi:tetrahydromethanopterin S-methyltransferase subunit B